MEVVIFREKDFFISQQAVTSINQGENPGEEDEKPETDGKKRETKRMKMAKNKNKHVNFL